MHTRHSPIQHLFESRGVEYRTFCGGSYAALFSSEENQQRTLESLGMCDLSGLQKLGLQGPEAAIWLTSKGLDVPTEIFTSRPLRGGGVIVRLGAEEFFLEDGITNTALPAFAARIDSHKGGLVRVERQEATFLLTGSRCSEVLAQTCGINFREVVPTKAVFTRVAGVSCSVLPESIGELPAHRLWVDPSYAVYLWDVLADISESLSGGIVGAGCIYPELLA
ncbi:MAG: hypothetical protein CMJ64_18225 [Planctomycetaceae bacterium]|nr:hypothetical protein [Planctomycetaceae bacterium]